MEVQTQLIRRGMKCRLEEVPAKATVRETSAGNRSETKKPLDQLPSTAIVSNKGQAPHKSRVLPVRGRREIAPPRNAGNDRLLQIDDR